MLSQLISSGLDQAGVDIAYLDRILDDRGGHSYGLDWIEQRLDGGERTWIRHPIDPYNSQYHDLFRMDIDGDGLPEIVTGTRYRAHCGNDPGSRDNVGICRSTPTT
ncbi:MAG: hypothetical protein E4H09_00400 [Spirochaetales bacterium]|nr:MAG: hypothetical protein E4H09_00400 [Spirochaetales bacterium]